MRPPTGFPSLHTVVDHFGSLTAGLLAAGQKPRGRTRWTREPVIEAMCEFKRETGRWPNSTDWKAAGGVLPPTRIVTRFFGTWREGLARAADRAA
jgi:hypothetical protein